MFGRFSRSVSILLLLCLAFPAAGNAVRIKDISSIRGVRPNQLFGYGLVIGLNGSGDKGGSFTNQGLANMLEHMGVHVTTEDIKVSNVAAVMVSATLPPFSRIGKKIDVTLSSIGDAKSLQGGTLLLTPLKGVDGKVYAIAQGAVSIGGFSAGGAGGGGVTKNHPTVGMISGGATVEKEIPLSLDGKRELTLMLKNPDFNTATRVADAINAGLGDKFAKPVDSGTIQFMVPANYQHDVVNLISEIGNYDVHPDTVAKIIVNEKTGTVVIGKNVRIHGVAIAHGNLSIQIKESYGISQPAPFAPQGGGRLNPPVQTENGVVVAPGGNTVVVPQSDVAVDEEAKHLMVIPDSNAIDDLVRSLNAIGVTPRDLITILQVMKAAGALQADLEIL